MSIRQTGSSSESYCRWFVMRGEQVRELIRGAAVSYKRFAQGTHHPHWVTVANREYFTQLLRIGVGIFRSDGFQPFFGGAFTDSAQDGVYELRGPDAQHLACQSNGFGDSRVFGHAHAQ